MALRLQGGCRCDAVRFEVTEVFDAGYCHCRRCRKRSGAPVFVSVIVPRAAFRLTAGALLPDEAERLGRDMLCSACRGVVLFDMGPQDLLSIGVGLFDEPHPIRPSFHQCASSALSWLRIDSDGLERFPESAISHPRGRRAPIDPGGQSRSGAPSGK